MKRGRPRKKHVIKTEMSQGKKYGKLVKVSLADKSEVYFNLDKEGIGIKLPKDFFKNKKTEHYEVWFRPNEVISILKEIAKGKDILYRERQKSLFIKEGTEKWLRRFGYFGAGVAFVTALIIPGFNLVDISLLIASIVLFEASLKRREWYKEYSN